MFKRLATMLSFALMASPALANSNGFEGFPGLPYQEVSVDTSEPGETLDAFMLRIAPTLDAFTAKSEWEACGAIAQAPDGRYGIVVGSVQAALSCAVSAQNVPAGFVAIGQSLHSHPRTKTIKPTASDLAIQAASNIRGLPYKAVEKNPYSQKFSDVDVSSGPGYLVADGRVLHQAGWDRVREVGRLASKAPIRRLPQR